MARIYAPPPTRFGASAPAQAKPAAARSPRSIAPPPTKFASAPRLQAKPAPGIRQSAPPPPTKFASRGAAPALPPARLGRSAVAPRAVQAMLVRHNFSGDTQSEVLVAKGQHRRHIIPNHLMKQALQAWKDTHPGEMTLSKLQEILDEMNDYVPNLHPGEGVQNSAMGMVSTWGASKLGGFDVGMSQPTDVSALFSKPSGFYQDRQKEMLDPYLQAIGSDPRFSTSTESAYSYAHNIVESTDFDWPGGTQHEFAAWTEAYNGFRSLQANAAHFPREGMLSVCHYFLSLAAPSGQHQK